LNEVKLVIIQVIIEFEFFIKKFIKNLQIFIQMKYKLIGLGYPISLLILTVGIILISLKGVIVKHFINQVETEIKNFNPYNSD